MYEFFDRLTIIQLLVSVKNAKDQKHYLQLKYSFIVICQIKNVPNLIRFYPAFLSIFNKKYKIAKDNYPLATNFEFLNTFS